jgi:predicted GNAT family acetyltransferase
VTLHHLRDDGFELSSDPGRLDLDRIHRWLSTDAYWAMGRPRDVLERAVAASWTYGVYRPDDGEQVAFARTVTDGATFGWLCDVYVDRGVRGSGVGTWMVDTIAQHLQSFGLRRVLLATHDAHEVYAKVGFRPLGRPDQWMELLK